MNRIAILLASALLLAGTVAAQESAPKEKVRTFTFTQDEPITMVCAVWHDAARAHARGQD